MPGAYSASLAGSIVVWYESYLGEWVIHEVLIDLDLDIIIFEKVC